MLWRGRWLATAAAATAAVVMLALAVADPDALIARHNVARWTAGGKIDTAYLAGLSDDAVPHLDELPEPLRSCTLAARAPSDDGLLSWNLARRRAAALLQDRPADVTSYHPYCGDPRATAP